jgi:hypothetical protein
MTQHKRKRPRQAPKRKPISNKPLRRHATKPSSDGLEIEALTLVEDMKRIADGLVAIKQDEGNRAFRRAAEALIQKLQAVIDGDTTVATLASKTVMLMHRQRWVLDVVKLFAESSGYPISFVTLLPKSLEIPDEGLESFDPEAVKKAFISYLNRRGIDKCKGWLIAGLHGEYDSIGKVWRIHWHLLVCGEMIKVIDRLRTEEDFKSVKGEAPRVRMSRKPLTDIPRVASYLLQSWWPNRPKGKFADDGTDHRKNRSRVPEHQQTRWLLWMDKRKLSDLVLMMGVRRTGSGFKMAKL